MRAAGFSATCIRVRTDTEVKQVDKNRRRPVAKEVAMRVDSVLGAWRSRRTRHFVRHFLEMTIAMVLGMIVLGAVFREIHLLVFGTGYEDAWKRHAELAAFAMAFNMTLPMVVWMRHRGHRWAVCNEMAAAMVVPGFGLIGLLWLGLISDEVVLPMQMALMLPSMIAVMLYRVDEYSKPHLEHRRIARELLDAVQR
jgi:hypothetical protein